LLAIICSRLGLEFCDLVRIFYVRGLKDSHLTTDICLILAAAYGPQNTWCTRPIVSVSRSSTYGLAKWLGIMFQNILVQSPFTVWIRLKFVNHKRLHATVPPHCLFCTIKATSMYTNIDTSHVLLKRSARITSLEHGSLYQEILLVGSQKCIVMFFYTSKFQSIS